MLEVRNLQFGYNGNTILDGINLKTRAGTIMAVVGPNGSGKTTLLKCICGIIRQWSGQIYISGEEIPFPSWKKMAALTGYMPQHIPFSGAITAFETILMGQCTNMTWSPGEKDILAVDRVMKEVGILELAQKDITRLSGGERQRVFIAQALVRKPRILFLDEPTSSLDLRYQFEVLEAIKHITIQRRTITVIILHDLNLAARYADHMVVLSQGKIVSGGSPKEVLTTALIRDVYGVIATVASAGLDGPRIHYAGLDRDGKTQSGHA